jgi:UDP-hydrolysing UDP-N-acetyl-D-glucosamine 2-epimerase
MTTIGVVTGARSDYSIYLPILRALQADPEFKLQLFVTGMHLSPEYGSTVQVIEADGFPIAERVPMLRSASTPEGVSASIGAGVSGFAQVFERGRPDLLLVLGDRFEMLAAVVAAMPFAIPVAHISGGETTEGAIDESFRHAITKMSHLHFVAVEPYRRRVIQMGEEPWRVTTTGEPSLDNLRTMSFMEAAELEPLLGMPLEPLPLLVTFHPVTLEYEKTGAYVQELLAALDAAQLPVVFTASNADAGGGEIRLAIESYVQTHSQARLVVNLGTRAYFSLMRQIPAMVGNSSSGIVEAASFALPVVNVGSRQRGRICGANVLHAECERNAILAATRRALTPEFRQRVLGMANPYGDGHAVETIMQILNNLPNRRKLLWKRFYDSTTGSL